MRNRFVILLSIGLAILASVGVAEDVTIDVDGDLVVEDEETPADNAEAVLEPEIDPRLTSEAIEKILSKMSARCLGEVRDSAMDYAKMSDRCRKEVARRVQRYLARLDKDEKGEIEEKPRDKIPEKSKRRSRKSKKQARAQRKAAAAKKKDDEYQKTLTTILGFVATLVAVIAGAMFFINRKLKAAGMYFPDPMDNAACCD